MFKRHFALCTIIYSMKIKIISILVLLIQSFWGNALFANEVTAEASIINTQGTVIGTVKFIQMPSGVLINATISKLKPGAHGFHIHSGKQCNLPDFSATKGHFNPLNHPHGFKNHKEYHLGDLPNLIVPKNGKVSQSIWLNDASLSEGLKNISGRTIVIHDGPDDYVSQPSGNSGRKIACGVIIVTN